MPRMRARSYLVMKGVVVRFSLGIFLSLRDGADALRAPTPLPWFAAAFGSPDSMTWLFSSPSTPSPSRPICSSASSCSGS